MSGLRAVRFLGGYLRERNAPAEEVRFGDTEATLLRGTGASPPAWVVLHGITVPGRAHPSLLRFARAVAASGATVLLPDVPPWRRLEIAPAATQTVIAQSVDFLAGAGRAHAVGLIGFSFGATQAVVAAADPALRDRVRAVVGFGAYCDLRRTLRAMLTGEHEWGGVHHRVEPDPYGRWIIASNFLTRIPAYAGMGAVAVGLRDLAAESSRHRWFAGDPQLVAVNARIRAGLAPDEQRLWDLLAAPHAGARVDAAVAERFADQLAAAGIGAEPLLDPRPLLAGVRARVVLAHGRDDRLIPYTESLRLAAALPPEARASATITGLFAHTGGSQGVRLVDYAREGARFVGLLRRALGAV